MAKKSKTQRAKASAARAARKEAREVEAAAKAQAGAVETEAPRKRLFASSKKSETSATSSTQTKAQSKAVEKKAKKQKKRRFGFLKDVRDEMKRVTWPTKQDVLRWSVVVVAALIFFGVFVALLDNAVITPLLVAISGLGA